MDSPRCKGSLTIVGTGIKSRFHITAESAAAIKHADKVFYLVSDDLTERWINQVNDQSASLAHGAAMTSNIEFDREDEAIRRMYEEVLRDKGVPFDMPPVASAAVS